MDLTITMLLRNSDPKHVMKGITHGACDDLVISVRLGELLSIWQHVTRKKVESKSNSNQEKTYNDGGKVAGNENLNGEPYCKRKDENKVVEDYGNEDDDPSIQMKPRVVWSIDLHRKLEAVVNQLGIEIAFSKRILDLKDNKISKLTDALKRSNQTMSTVNQNLSSVFSYNSVVTLFQVTGMIISLGARKITTGLLECKL